MRNLLALVLLSVGALVAGTAAGQGSGNAQGARPDCVTANGGTTLGAYGFNHVVHIDNHCDRQVTCTVTTSVNPTPSTARVDAGQSTDVLMMREAPGREYVATVSCQ